jgi:hypothetical protein
MEGVTTITSNSFLLPCVLSYRGTIARMAKVLGDTTVSEDFRAFSNMKKEANLKVKTFNGDEDQLLPAARIRKEVSGSEVTFGII